MRHERDIPAGRRLRDRLDHARISRVRLAEILGCSKATVTRLTAGYGTPESYARAFAALDKMEVSPW